MTSFRSRITVFLSVFSAAVCLAGFSTVLRAQDAVQVAVQVADRHVFVLHGGEDTLWGTYMFGVKNDSSAPQQFRSAVSLPKEITDFQAQDGLTPQELQVDPDGGLFFDKEFPAGLTLISIGFKIPGSFGAARMTLQSKVDMNDVSVMSKLGGLTLASEFGPLKKTPDQQMGKFKYTTLKSQAKILAGTKLVVSAGNLPEGRYRFWLIGSIVAALTLIIAAAMVIKTRPALNKVDVVSP